MRRTYVVTSWGVILAAVFFVLGTCGQCLAYNPGDPEFRGFWIDAWGAGAHSQTEVNTLLGVVGNGSSIGQIRAANCNAVVLQVRRNCDANYPSTMGEPYMSGLSPSNFNALQAVINAAHDTTGGKKRVEVHAWIVTFRTSGGTVYQQHDDPATGSLSVLDNFWGSLDDTGAVVGDSAFDPGHPLAQDYTVNVAMDIVNNFDVDGIHFDYIRFTGYNQGYNPTSVARYNARYSISGQPAPNDEQWKQWRRDAVTSVVRKVYAKVQASKPHVKVSGSFVTWNPSPSSSTRTAFQGTRPYYDVYSDWDSWIQEGIVDAAIPMTYYDLGGSYPDDWAKWIKFEKDRHGSRHMYIGPGIYLNSLSNAITEIQQTRTASPAGNYADGFCGYSYRVPYVGGTWAGFSPSLVSQVTTTWADIPEMPWKTNPTKGHISGTLTFADTGKWADGALGAVVTITGPETRTMRCDGTGFYAFVDLTPGTYTVTASYPTYDNMITQVDVQIGSVTGNMYIANFAFSRDPAPVISNVQVSNVTNTSATITWDTDVPSDSKVQYGMTTSYGSTTPVDPTYVTSHSVTLTGLTPGTIYHYRAISDNANGSALSPDDTFATSGPPSIMNVAAGNLTASSATITWTTTTPADSTVNYGLTSSYGNQVSDAVLVTSHSVNLTGLTASTTYNYQVVSTNAQGTATSTNYTFTTASPPSLSGVAVSGVTTTSATITWNTNQLADSRVNYGTTLSYGLQKSDGALVTSHSIALADLLPGTVYHYQCVSVNANGTAASTDHTFTTNEAPTELIIDEDAAVRSGTWTLVTGSGYENDYRYASCRRTSANAYCTWSPNIIMAGNYDVYCRYPSITGATPTAKAKFTVNYNGASTSATLNQANNTNTWNLIASNVPFAAGTSGNVVLNNLTGETNSSRRVLADAVRFVYIPPTPDDVIVDDVDQGATTVGTWLDGTYLTGSYNNSYKHCSNDISTETASHRWTPSIAAAGAYNVYCWYTSGVNRTTAAHYTIHHAGGTASATVNQTTTGAQWVRIGTALPFAAGTTGYVKLDNVTGETTGSKAIIADAMRWEYAGPAPGDITSPIVEISAPSAVITRSGPVSYTINYTDDTGVSAITLSSSDITLNRTGTADGTVTVSGSGTETRTVTISSITGTGSLGILIAAGTATDAAGNSAQVAGPSTTFVVDNTPPTISISAPSTSITTGGPVTYTVSYTGADAVLLSSGHITLNKTGTANGNVSVSGTGTASRTVTISSIMGTGTLGISIAAASANDTAGNTAPAAGPSATFEVDNTAPSVSIGVPSASSTASGPITYTVMYGGATTITLSSADVTLIKTGTADGTVSVTGSGSGSRTVTISSITGSGSLGISIAAGTAFDVARHAAPAAGPSEVFVVDNTDPVISSVTVAPTMAAVGDPIHVVVDVSDDTGVTTVFADATALVKSPDNKWSGDVFAIDPHAVYQISVVATDALGNSATDTSGSYKSAPVLTATCRDAWCPVAASMGGLYIFRYCGRVTEAGDDNFTLNDGSRSLTVHAVGYKTKLATGDLASVHGMLNVVGILESQVSAIVKY